MIYVCVRVLHLSSLTTHLLIAVRNKPPKRNKAAKSVVAQSAAKRAKPGPVSRAYTNGYVGFSVVNPARSSVDWDWGRNNRSNFASTSAHYQYPLSRISPYGTYVHGHSPHLPAISTSCRLLHHLFVRFSLRVSFFSLEFFFVCLFPFHRNLFSPLMFSPQMQLQSATPTPKSQVYEMGHATCPLPISYTYSRDSFLR